VLGVEREPAVLVPDLAGLTEAEALRALQAAGLAADVDVVRDGSGPGRVVGQDPLPGTAVARATRVAVELERTPSRLAVPTAVAAGGASLLLLLLVVAAVSWLARRGRPGRRRPGKVVTRPVFPAGEICVERLDDRPDHMVTLRRREDPGTQVLEEVL
jgi:hypothetical protein